MKVWCEKKKDRFSPEQNAFTLKLYYTLNIVSHIPRLFLFTGSGTEYTCKTSIISPRPGCPCQSLIKAFAPGLISALYNTLSQEKQADGYVGNAIIHQFYYITMSGKQRKTDRKILYKK